MNTELPATDHHMKKDYQQLHKILQNRCLEISKDNDALSSRLISLKLLVYKAGNQCRKMQDRLDYHGIDYHAAAVASAANHPENNFSTVKPQVKGTRRKRTKIIDPNKTPPSSKLSMNSSNEQDAGLPNPFLTGDNVIT